MIIKLECGCGAKVESDGGKRDYMAQEIIVKEWLEIHKDCVGQSKDNGMSQIKVDK
jgi:hypothetical protein